MSVGFGFSVGDILACGKFCHEVYRACFSEAHDASASWISLGKELALLGDALQSLCSDSGIIPQDPFGGRNADAKEQRALDAVRVVVGDFRETLKDLREYLKKYESFGNPDAAGKQYWLRISYTMTSGEVDKFRARVAMHTRAVNLLLHPLIYQSQKNVQDAVSSIHTRIDTIDQVLQALLVVASEQLTSSTFRSPKRIADRAYLRTQNSHPQYLLTGAPAGPPTIPAILAASGTEPRGGGQQMLRTRSHSASDNRYEPPAKIGIPRTSTEPKLSPCPPAGAAILPGGHGNDDRRSAPPPVSAEMDSPGHHSQRTPQRRYSDASEVSDNVISRAFWQSAMGGAAKDRPIEHWITAAMHWYFKAEEALDESDNSTVSLEAYLGLTKSSWIVENIISKWEYGGGLPEEIQRNIKTLVAAIVSKFRNIKSKEMPDIRNLDPQNYEIWHKDIVLILVRPSLPLPSRVPSRMSTLSPGAHYDDLTPPGRPSDISSNHACPTSPGFDLSLDDAIFPSRDSTPFGGHRVHHSHGQDRRDDHATTRAPSLTDGCDRSPRHGNFPGSPVSGSSPSPRGSNESLSSPSSLDHIPAMQNPQQYDPIDSMRTGTMDRSPSISTISTKSSGRIDSSSSTHYTVSTVPVLSPRGSPGARREPVPTSSPASYTTTTTHLPVTDSQNNRSDEGNYNGHGNRDNHDNHGSPDDLENYEGVGERTILDTTNIMWASPVSGGFKKGTVKIFWHQSTAHFRIYTRYSDRPRRSHSDHVSLRGTELIPEYAYGDEPVIFLRKAVPHTALNNGSLGAGRLTGGDSSRVGHVYKFYTPESMFDFQRALTSEGVFQDLVGRVSSVKVRRESEKVIHEYHGARLQLWHENPPADALLPDGASGMTGVSQATRPQLVLQCSRLMIYFAGSGCFLTCFLTDDITLKQEGTKLTLVPTKYKGGIARTKSPRSVKAAMRGTENSKGGFKLDKEKISPDDQYTGSFEDYLYIQINFRDARNLIKFQKLWNEMMDTRRVERRRISDLKQRVKDAHWAPL